MSCSEVVVSCFFITPGEISTPPCHGLIPLGQLPLILALLLTVIIAVAIGLGGECQITYLLGSQLTIQESAFFMSLLLRIIGCCQRLPIDFKHTHTLTL